MLAYDMSWSCPKVVCESATLLHTAQAVLQVLGIVASRLCAIESNRNLSVVSSQHVTVAKGRSPKVPERDVLAFSGLSDRLQLWYQSTVEVGMASISVL